MPLPDRGPPAPGTTGARALPDRKDLQAVHGGLLLALLTVPVFVRPLAAWPWYLLVPLSVYGLVVSAIGPLRRTVGWVRLGSLDRGVAAATAGIVLVSSSALVGYAVLFHPDVHDLAEQIALGLPVPLVIAGILFATVNALLEEAVFRGVLLDALDAQLGPNRALLAQAVAFGVGHSHGYPPGVIGVILASVYGLVLGWLRLRSQGMAAVVLAHVGADATIFALVVLGGRPGFPG